MTSQQKFFYGLFLVVFLSLMAAIFFTGKKEPISSTPSIEKFLASSADHKFIALSRPVHDSLEAVWSPFLPQEVWDSINFDDSTDVNTLEFTKATRFAQTVNRSGRLNWCVSATMFSFDLKEDTTPEEPCHFNPLMHGFIVQHHGETLYLSFDSPNMLKVEKVMDIPQGHLDIVEIPKFEKGAKVEWTLEGYDGDPSDLIEGKIIIASSQNGYYHATTEWSGGKKLNLYKFEKCRFLSIISGGYTYEYFGN